MRPQNAYDAQFSVHYIMSASMTRGQFTLDELEDDALQDQTILDQAASPGTRLTPTPPTRPIIRVKWLSRLTTAAVSRIGKRSIAAR